MQTILSRVKITHQLNAAFLVMVLLVLGLVGFSYHSMEDLQELFGDYRTQARESLLLANLSEDMTDARIDVLKYRLDNKPEHRQGVADNVQEIVNAQSKIKEIVKDPLHLEQLSKLEAKALEYTRIFDQATAFQDQRHEIVARLDELAPNIRKNITDIMETAYRDSDPTAAFYAGRAQQHYLLMRVYKEKYLTGNEPKEAERALAEAGLTLQELKDLQLELQNPQRLAWAKEAEAEVQVYAAEFSKLVDVINKRNELYFTGLDRLGPEVMNGYDDLFEDVEKKQNTLGPQAIARINTVSQNAIIAGIFIWLLSTLIALFMGRFLKNNFAMIIDQMRLVAEGKSKIMPSKRGDEIGAIENTLYEMKGRIEQAIYQSQMIEEMPTGVMMADPKNDFKITYMNKEVKSILRPLEKHLPLKVDEMVGQSIDNFHKNPEHQRRILSSHKNLPVSTKIKIGDEYMDLKVTAIMSSDGSYVGPMLTWKVVTAMTNLANSFEERVGSVVKSVEQAATDMQTMAASLAAAVEETTYQSSAVASASEQASANVQTVASAAEEMAASIQEISRNVSDAAMSAKSCAESGYVSQEKLVALQNAVNEIDGVIQAINAVAEQTNLLALNATIEAARAGDAGKGFAVVASEVKSLANETHKMTEQISKKVEDIKQSANETISSVQEIISQISVVDSKSSGIAAAIEEQSSSTREISRSVQEAASGTNEVSCSIVEVQKAANNSSVATEQLKGAADGLASQALHLKEAVDVFLKEVRAS